jgi:hypothetical protein
MTEQNPVSPTLSSSCSGIFRPQTRHVGEIIVLYTHSLSLRYLGYITLGTPRQNNIALFLPIQEYLDYSTKLFL